ncbi:MAG TPA: C2 domain-containing protein [Polyangia bacterium]|jgi:hypothetical protein
MTSVRVILCCGALLLCGCGGGGGGGGGGGIKFHGEQEALPGFSKDTGYQPAISPVQVKLVVTSGGGLTADAEATASGNELTPKAGTGLLALEASLKVQVSLKIDTSGINYEGVLKDIEYGIPRAEASFDPFLLDSSTTLTADIPDTDLGEIPLAGVPGAGGTLVLSVSGTLNAEFKGVCAAARDGVGQYTGTTTTGGTLTFNATVNIEIPLMGTKSFGPFPITVDVPALEAAMDLGMRTLATGAETTADPPPCAGGGGGDGGVAHDGGGGGGDGGGGCDGCLDNGGACQLGTGKAACGRGGAACQACTGAQTCVEGQCVTPGACGPGSCNGCCDGDTCVGGNGDAACGHGGRVCELCQGDATCQNGYCVAGCGPQSCAGCCSNGVCASGINDIECGTGGGACANCGSGRQCSFGHCVDLSCADTCTGCCDGTGCHPGNETTRCGIYGAACDSCGANRTCSNGSCVVAGTSLWDVQVVSAQVAATNCGGSEWDWPSGLPDPYVHVRVIGAGGVYQADSSYKSDTLSPVWNETLLTGMTAADLKSYLEFSLYDDDYGTDDTLGVLDRMDPTDADFGGVLVTKTVARDCGSQPGYTIVYRLLAH